MEKIILNKNEDNIIYQITLITNNNIYYYIGLTTRKLKDRLHEHLNNKKSSVYQFIKDNQVNILKVEMIEKVKFSQLLDIKETKAILKHILKYGKRKHNLINKDFKGLDKLTLKQLKELDKEL